MSTKKRILVAVDGSDQSIEAVRYAAAILAPEKVEATLFNVKMAVPETFYDQMTEPEERDMKLSIREWSNQLARNIDSFMTEAEKPLIQAGFVKESINKVVVPRKAGYARDILEEAHKGYGALIMGRKGMGALDLVTMGSVAAKIVESLESIPIILVAGNPETDKCLVAFDQSRGTATSIISLVSFCDLEQLEVMLCHIVRPLNIPFPAVPVFFNKSKETDWVDANTRKIIPAMVDSRRLLFRNGLTEKSFSTLIAEEKTSRAEGIFNEAKGMRAGTILTGRRGLSAVPEFSIGRVSRKILDMAKDRAVWIT